MVRLGVVGAGIIWRKAHEPALREVSDTFPITALCARSEERRAALRGEYPGARVFADYRELVVCPEVDAVLVVTPIPLNAVVGVAALEAGKDLYVEKPMAADLNQARRLVEAERKSGRRIYPLEQVPYLKMWHQVREAIASGEVGAPVMFDRLAHSYLGLDHDPGGYARTAWREQSDYPLGPLLDGGIHHIACHSLLFGVPESVYAVGQKLREGYGRYDNICMLVEHPGGVRGFFSHSAFLGCERNYFHIRCAEGLISVEGSRFTVEAKFGEKRTVECDPNAGRTLHHTMWRELAACAGRAPRYTSRDAFNDIATLMAADRSVRSGKPERVERA